MVVIRRPVHEEGISLEEAKRQMDAYRTARPPENSVTDGTGKRFLSMIGMGMGGGFPGGGQKPDGELPEGFDGQMPNGEKPELPDGEVPEMPGGERPTPPSGQGSPTDGNAPAGDSTSDTTPTA